MSSELLDMVITSREEQGKGVVIFDLTSQGGDPLPMFKAGAHIDVYVQDDLIRQYSLCCKPNSNKSYRIAVLNDPGSRGGSVDIYNNFQLGKSLKISSPRNHFPLAANATRTILAGGGIGITPMIAMAYELQETAQDFELHYCTKTEGAGAFVEELKNNFGSKVIFHYDDAGDEQLLDPKRLFLPCTSDTHIYVCGPTGFMDWVINNAKELGYPSGQVHFEYFSAEVDSSGESFEVYCEQSGITVTVADNDTIAKALRKAGIKVNMSCEEGVCGTCITDVLEGEPDHRDHFLTDEEKEDNDQIALCCSRAKCNRLVI